MRAQPISLHACAATLLIGTAALAGPACYCTPPPDARAPSAAKSKQDEQRERFAKLSDAYYWTRMMMEPAFGVRLGYHDYDGQLPPATPKLLATHEQLLRQIEAKLEALDGSVLNATERLEREAILYQLRDDLFAYEQREPYRNPLYYVNALGLTVYIARPYAPVETRAAAVRSLASRTPQYLVQANENLEPRIPRAWIDAAHKQLSGLVDYLRNDVAPALPGLDTSTQEDLQSALNGMASAVLHFDEALQARLPNANDDFALGEPALLHMLAATQGVDSTLDRLARVAEDDIASNMQALTDAAHAIDPQRSLSDVVAEVVADKPRIVDVVSVASDQAVHARAFVAAHQIATIPSDHLPEVRETPPYMRFNIAFLEGSGPFEKAKVPSFYYISPPDPSWPAEQQRDYVPDYASLASITVHELWPGHYLQALHMKQLRSRVLRTFRNYATSEGWAHYCEQLMAEQGFDAVPNFRIGQLVMALVRDVRFLAALGLHARGMTVEQAANLFRTRAFQDAGNAEQQAERGTFDPMYMSYTLGKLMILKLRSDYRAREEAAGRVFSLHDFHDRFLSYGALPIPVIRREMLGPEAGPAL